jgi:hypothetical protein
MMKLPTRAARDRDIIIAALMGPSASAENTGAIDLMGLAFEFLKAEASAVTDALPDTSEAKSLGFALQGHIDALSSFILWHCEMSLLPLDEGDSKDSNGAEDKVAGVRAILEKQARDDVKCCLGDDEYKPPHKPEEWFRSWIDGECECVLGPLSRVEAFTIYEAAFKAAVESNGAEHAEGEADHA